MTKLSRTLIADRLEAIASGDSYWESALREASKLPEAQGPEEASLLQRWMTGAQSGRDRFALQDLAIQILRSEQPSGVSC